jgi:hypothetical protein
MAPSALHGFFDIQSGSAVTSPPAALQKSDAKVREVPSNVELDNLVFGKVYKGPTDGGFQISKEPAPSGRRSPTTPNELEMSRPSSPLRDETVGVVQTWNSEPMNKWRILTCCLLYFANGMNDSGRCLITHINRECRDFPSLLLIRFQSSVL